MVYFWQCEKCKSNWPALTTVEAFRNHKKANQAHPNEKCHEGTRKLNAQ